MLIPPKVNAQSYKLIYQLHAKLSLLGPASGASLPWFQFDTKEIHTRPSGMAHNARSQFDTKEIHTRPSGMAHNARSQFDTQEIHPPIRHGTLASGHPAWHTCQRPLEFEGTHSHSRPRRCAPFEGAVHQPHGSSQLAGRPRSPQSSTDGTFRQRWGNSRRGVREL